MIGLEKLVTEPTTTIANPASVFCEQNSGTLEIITDLSGGQS
jgi:putative hemolysin